MMRRSGIKIGLDFDNTIVCYDNAVKELATRHFDVPSSASTSKIEIRQYLRDKRGEDAWVKFQGCLYGPGMVYAKPYQGCIEALWRLKDKEAQLAIISHRSKKPYSGEAYDLHGFASDWIKKNLEVDLFRSGMHKEIYFLETKEEKVDKIKELECEVFVDDLVELLEMPSFPNRTKRILFDPYKKFANKVNNNYSTVSSWLELVQRIGGSDQVEGW